MSFYSNMMASSALPRSPAVLRRHVVSGAPPPRGIPMRGTLGRRNPFERRRPLLGQVGLIDAETKDDILNHILITDIKNDEINLWSQAQGGDLASVLNTFGALNSWNQNWNQAAMLKPQIDNIIAKLQGPPDVDPEWSWSVTEDSTTSNWITAVETLYNLMQQATGEQPPPPVPGPGPVPEPEPEPEPVPDDTASTTSDIVLYSVAGIGGAAVIGSIIYMLTQ